MGHWVLRRDKKSESSQSRNACFLKVLVSISLGEYQTLDGDPSRQPSDPAAGSRGSRFAMHRLQSANLTFPPSWTEEGCRPTVLRRAFATLPPSSNWISQSAKNTVFYPTPRFRKRLWVMWFDSTFVNKRSKNYLLKHLELSLGCFWENVSLKVMMVKKLGRLGVINSRVRLYFRWWNCVCHRRKGKKCSYQNKQ